MAGREVPKNALRSQIGHSPPQERIRRDSPRPIYNVEMTERVQPASFRKPSSLEALFNRALGALVGLGIGPGYMQLLLVRGRKTGRLYSTPVNLLQVGVKSYLVAPRGRTQ